MMTTSYNGWPASQNPAEIGVKRLDLPGHPNAFPPGVKAGDVSIVLGYVAAQINARVEKLGEGCWGYNYRKNRNAGNLSCHASGTAIDINAPQHPNGKRGTWTAVQIAEVRKILAECSGVVKWGEDFRTTVDGMHFEIHGDAAQVKAAAVKLRKPKPVSHSNPYPLPVLGSRAYLGQGGQITETEARWVQWVCSADRTGKADADFGPMVAAAQKHLHLSPADGKVGKATLAAFAKVTH